MARGSNKYNAFNKTRHAGSLYTHTPHDTDVPQPHLVPAAGESDWPLSSQPHPDPLHTLWKKIDNSFIILNRFTYFLRATILSPSLPDWSMA